MKRVEKDIHGRIHKRGNLGRFISQGKLTIHFCFFCKKGFRNFISNKRKFCSIKCRGLSMSYANIEDYREYQRKYQKIWGKNNKEKRLFWSKRIRIKKRQEFLQKMGGKCVKCGFSDWRALQVDHINGGGGKEIKTIGSSYPRYYKKILADKDGKYQLLCANCNWIKKDENNENANVPTA